MRKYPFATDMLLTEEEILHVREKVVTTFQEQLVARDYFPVEQNPDALFYRWYEEDEISEALITHSGKPQSDDFPDLSKNDLPWPVIHKESLLNWRDVRISQQTGNSKLLDRTIRQLTRQVAEAEDRLLISGECTTWSALGLEGLFTATGRGSSAASGVWPDNAINDINTARAALQDAGYVALEPVLLGPPAMIKCLDAFMANTDTTYRQALLNNNLVSDVRESSKAYAADCGQDSVVLFVPGEDNFWAAQGIPLESRMWEDRTGNMYLTVRETIVPVIGRANSIYELTDITCS